MKYGFWLMALLNIFLDYTLIRGRLGFPALGFDGAAYASVISEAAGLSVVLGIIFYKKLDHRFSLFHFTRFNKQLSRVIFHQSSPLVLQWLLSIIAWMVFYIFIEHHGKRPLAISNAMRTIFGVVGIFAWAFASTSNAMVSNIIGQGKKDKVILLINKIMKLSFIFTVSLCVVINIFPDIFLGIYTKDPGFILDAIPVLRTVTAGVACMSIATVWLNAVTGTANTRINLAIEVVAIALYTLYVYLVLKVWDLGLVWAWASELLYWGILFLLSFLYIRSGKWKKKVI
jgi:Na+-driven multidrug efflux pump